MDLSHKHVYMRAVCMYVYVCMCMYVCMYVCMYARIKHSHTNTPTCTHQKSTLTSHTITAHMQALAPSLQACHALHTLDISGSQIGPEGACYLAAAITRCSQLRDIDLTGNMIEDVSFLSDFFSSFYCRFCVLFAASVTGI